MRYTSEELKRLPALKHLPRSREQARRLGSAIYFDGKRCKNGHLDAKRVKGRCVQCHREHDDKAYKEKRSKEISNSAD